MGGVLEGVRVLDLSWGVAGPMTAMLMADQGADVVKIEPPGGDPFRGQLGYKVWQRGKRSAVLDLKAEADRAALHALARNADVLIESYAPGVAERLGVDYNTLSAINPRLIVVSITAYGRDNPLSDRPGYDALVAARVGLHWEQRGWPEGAINHMAGRPDPFPDIEINYDWVQGPPREGPVFPASHWPSLGAFFAASVGVSAALRAREVTGRGQWVETSLLQGTLACSAGAWQRVSNPDAEGFDTWILGSKSPKGHFECADGRWVHNWVPNPRFILQASQGATLNATPDLTVQNDPDRFGIGPEELLVMMHYQPILAEAVKKFAAKEWVEASAVAEMTMQDVRPPEEALTDPLFMKDGCVVEIEDPDLGPLRQVGVTYRLSKTKFKPMRPAPRVGEHTEAVKAEAARAVSKEPASKAGRSLKAPLEGVRVIDLGLAIAGPYGAQILGDMGAEVIKINALYDVYWHRTHIAYCANRGKRSIALNLKDPAAMQVLLDLVKTADVVHHNMRYDAAERLKIDYESLKAINPKLIYCHTRGFETGEREGLPGNDQTGGCLAGVQYEDGGMADGGKPLWSFSSLGDTGNGFLSAVGVIQALYHRDRTGEGQFVDTSIVNAHLLNTSYAVARPDGSGFARPRVDRMNYGFNAGCRLYKTADDWICIVAATEAEWDALFVALGAPELAAEFPTADARAQNDKKLASKIEAVMAGRPAALWMAAFDAGGVPAEISSATFSQELYQNEEYLRRKWITRSAHAMVGTLEQPGLAVDFSDTPGTIQCPPLIVGDQTEAILRELGRSDEEIDALIGKRAVAVYPPRAGQAEMKSPWDSGPAKIKAKDE
jgi:crotonobetainyl-CoA:carnitine CoA-transferase CaiB-like acyl-CoA transferase